jgi:FixJ family two-component response regulator
VTTGPLVTIVDDDESVRASMLDLLRELGYAARTFASSEDFLASDALGPTKCLILDVCLPGMSGPELQLELARLQFTIPIVFVTFRSDGTDCAALLARGAVACLSKPFTDTELLDALHTALGSS